MATKTTPLETQMLALQDPVQAENLSRFFRTAPGEYGAGDRFLGIKVPLTRQIVKAYWRDCAFKELEHCIQSPCHEIRLATLLILVQRFRHAKSPEAARQCIDFYLKHLAFVNNWDLVDLSCYELLGRWLLDKDRTLLFELAKHGKTLWEQRIAIVSTMQFLRHGECLDTLKIAEILLPHPHDLINKAVGWLLREVGKRDMPALLDFLAIHHRAMARTTLRYAIERFPEAERRTWLAR